ILKMDRSRGNIVVSRRAVLEETRAEARSELVASLKEGQVLEGVVKNITDYGAFVDLGGVDGLLHVTDIAWRRINHPSEALQIGQHVKVQVIRFNPETQRISLGMKQLEADPWDGVQVKYPPGAKYTGRVTNITDYGAFVELEPGVEGLVHVSEMSWTKKNVHPGKIVSTSQEVEVMVLEVDPEKRRISLGLKQTMQNPWEAFLEHHPLGSVVEGEIKNITEFGLFVGLDNDIDGMVHLSDLDWEQQGEEAVKRYSKGDTVRAQVLDVDVEKERISLGIKQLGEDPFRQAIAGLKRGDRVTCTVREVTNATEFGLFVGLEGDVDGMVHMSDIAWGVSGEEALQLHRKGETVKAQVLDVDIEKERISLGMKQLEGGGGAGTGTGAAIGGVRKGETVTVVVRAIQDAGLDVQVGDDGPVGFVKRTDLGRDRDEQRPERFQVGQHFDALVTGFDRSKKPNFSVKALQIAEEKQAVAQYGSSDSGASLGDILGAALKEKAEAAEAKPKKKK
ncbi:MAG: S1 RNA-binding domain-containing protein, partial [Sphingomicrobium sp.]